MNDMRATIIPKSDQMNADDLIGRTQTITVTKVLLSAEKEQPVAVHFEGDNGKPYMPGKSMRRVMVNTWGPDANVYVGRSMTLYRDEKVQFGGLAVGGIRISHMSHIDGPITMALTATRANKKPFTVKPLRVEKPEAPATAPDKPRRTMAQLIESLAIDFGAARTAEDYDALVARDDTQWLLDNAKTDARAVLTKMMDDARKHTAGDSFPGDLASDDEDPTIPLITAIEAADTAAALDKYLNLPATRDAVKRLTPEQHKAVETSVNAARRGFATRAEGGR